MVEATGLEPAASCSQSRHSTKLSYASMVQRRTNPDYRPTYYIIPLGDIVCQVFFEIFS